MKKATIYALTSVLLWSTLAPAVSYSMREMSMLMMLFVSLMITSIVYVVAAFMTGEHQAIRDYTPKRIVGLSMLGLLGIFGYMSLYNTGIEILGAQDACVINYLWPVLTTVFAVIILKEKLRLSHVIVLVMAFAGTAIITLKAGGFQSDNFDGVLITAAGAVCYALFSVLNKRYAKNELIDMTIFYIVSTIAAGIACAVTGGFTPVKDPGTWVAVIWIGVSSVSYLFWAKALSSGKAADVSALAYLTPALSMIWSILLLGEAFDARSLLGLLLIVSGCAYQTLSDSRAKKALDA